MRRCQKVTNHTKSPEYCHKDADLIHQHLSLFNAGLLIIDHLEHGTLLSVVLEAEGQLETFSDFERGIGVWPWVRFLTKTFSTAVRRFKF